MDEKPEPAPVDPPKGKRRSRFHAFTTAHPTLWAARHVVLAVGQVLATILGVGLAFRFLVPNIPWPDWHLPDWDLPRPDLPDLTPHWVERIEEEARDVVRTVLDFADPVLGTTKYWVPIVIALAVASREVDRRRRSNEEPKD